MSIPDFAKLAGLVVLLTGVLFETYSFRRIHIPEFVELQSDVAHLACVESCHETCRRNNVPADDCDCSHCFKE